MALRWARLTAAAASVLALCACEPETAAPNSVVTVGLQLEPPMLDPTRNPAAAISQVTHLNVYEGLTRIDETGRVLPGLAKSWEISEDGRTYTFFLRENVRFSDGTTFEAADVRFSFERNAAPDSTNPRRSYFTQIERIETPDNGTVVLRLAEPSGLFLFNLAESASVVVAPESADANGLTPVGTGPFRFGSWAPGESVTLTRNPLFRSAGEVALDGVIFRFIGDAAAQVAALQAGDVDYLPILAAVESAAALAADDRFQVLIGSTEGETILALNHSRAPFDDLRVRRALSHAIDRVEIIRGAMFGYGTPIGSHFAPHHPAYVDLTATYTHDPDRARELLSQAALPDGQTYKITLPPTTYAQRSGEIIASQLADVGFEVELISVEWARWLESVYGEANYDMTIVAHVEPMDIGIYADPSYYFRYDGTEFRNIVEAADRAVDAETRDQLWGRAQRKLAEDAVNVFLFELPKVGAARAELTGLWTNAPMFINDMASVRWETASAN